MTEYLDDFVQVLLAQGAVTVLTATRIYGEVLPREEYRGLWKEPSSVQPTIVVREAPEAPALRQGPLWIVTYEVICFGKDAVQARQVHAAVRDALNDQQKVVVSGERKLQWLTQITPGQGGADQDKWEFFAPRWEVAHFV